MVSCWRNRCHENEKLVPYFLILDLAMLIDASVTLSLDYYNTLCMRLPLKMIWKLQLMQNVVA